MQKSIVIIKVSYEFNCFGSGFVFIIFFKNKLLQFKRLFLNKSIYLEFIYAISL